MKCNQPEDSAKVLNCAQRDAFHLEYLFQGRIQLRTNSKYMPRCPQARVPVFFLETKKTNTQKISFAFLN